MGSFDDRQLLSYTPQTNPFDNGIVGVVGFTLEMYVASGWIDGGYIEGFEVTTWMNDLSGLKTGCVHMVGSAMMTDVTLLMVSRASCHFAFCYLSHLISL